MSLPAARCPICQHVLDDATVISDLSNKLPKPGDFSICIYCGEALRFDQFATYFLRAASLEELRVLQQQHATQYRLLRQAQDVIRRG
jgi:hypothetical protein